MGARHVHLSRPFHSFVNSTMAQTISTILARMQEENASLLDDSKSKLDNYLRLIRTLVANIQERIERTPFEGNATDALDKATAKKVSAFSSSLYGKIIVMQYSPKLAKSLPYYDLCPVCLPLIPSMGGAKSGSFFRAGIPLFAANASSATAFGFDGFGV